jgi:serine phosphatase RsbU (regulator of sigma subunit)/anti-sigma regulatory factor (Ser/Thr protein kinase)
MAVPLIEPARIATLRLAFAPNAESARAVSVAIRAFLAEQGVEEKELFPCELCIAEASNNAIEYSEGPSRDLKLVAEALVTQAQIELRVTDHTAGFALRERIPQPSPLTDRGRGLFLIQSAMDEVRYLRGAKENILVMRKKRRVVPPPPPDGEPGSVDLLSLEKCRRQLSESRVQMTRMAEELLLRSETLSSVFRCCAELGRMNTASEGFEGRLFVDLLHLTSADWYVLRLISPDGRRLLVAATSEPGLASKPIALLDASGAPTGIEAIVAVSRKAALFDVRECGERPEALRTVGPEGAGLVCPLCFGGELVGTIAVGRRSGDFPLGRLQDEVIRTFAEFLAIQTLNMRRQKEEVRDRVVARELEIAQDIQQLLLPRSLPQLAGFGLAGGWKSAREVGGDFYDAIATGDQSLLLMMADVMGKGVPAALFATEMRGLLRGLAASSSDPADLLRGLNRLLYTDLSSVAMFITAQIVHVDLKARELTVASAGHCPILFVQPGRRSVTTLPIRGLPLGVRPETVYPQQTARMGTPAALLMHTDGLTEARSASGTAYGQRRLQTWMQAHTIPGRNAAEMRDRLATELNRFRGDSVMADDQAFLLLVEESAGVMNPESAGERRSRSRLSSFPFAVNS